MSSTGSSSRFCSSVSWPSSPEPALRGSDVGVGVAHLRIKRCGNQPVNIYAIEQTRLRGHLRVGGVETPLERADAATGTTSRLKFDFHTGLKHQLGVQLLPGVRRRVLQPGQQVDLWPPRLGRVVGDHSPALLVLREGSGGRVIVSSSNLRFVRHREQGVHPSGVRH